MEKGARELCDLVLFGIIDNVLAMVGIQKVWCLVNWDNCIEDT